jgi:hypothetical protein
MEDWQPRAAFVVLFREGTDLEVGRVEGKVEHIVSYRSARFHSTEELFTFMARILQETRALTSSNTTDPEPRDGTT